MRLKMVSVLAAAVLVLAIALPMMTSAAPHNGKATTVTNQREDEGRRKGGERHPHIRAAIHELREAKRELQAADHDFGGHRDEAVEAVDKAIRQLEEALKFDKK